MKEPPISVAKYLDPAVTAADRPLGSLAGKLSPRTKVLARTQRPPRLIGRTLAMELLLTGDPIDAERALALGLVNAVVAPGGLQEKVFALADRVASQAPLAVAAIRHAVHAGIDVPIRDALDLERVEFVRVFDTEDGREGVSAFLDKRPATWQGR